MILSSAQGTYAYVVLEDLTLAGREAVLPKMVPIVAAEEEVRVRYSALQGYKVGCKIARWADEEVRVRYSALQGYKVGCKVAR